MSWEQEKEEKRTEEEKSGPDIGDLLDSLSPLDDTKTTRGHGQQVRFGLHYHLDDILIRDAALQVCLNVGELEPT